MNYVRNRNNIIESLQSHYDDIWFTKIIKYIQFVFNIV